MSWPPLTPNAPPSSNPDLGSGSFAALRNWSLPTRVVRVLGDPRFRLEGTLLALFADFDGTSWTVEEPGVLRHWTTDTGREHSRAALSDFEMLWAFAAKVPLLASAADDWSLWQRNTGKLLRSGRTPSWITALALEGNGRHLATGHDDGMVRLWDSASGVLRREWTTGSAPVSALQFSPSGQLLAAANEACDIHLWNVALGLAVGRLQGHTDRVTALAWHPEERHLVSSGWDTTARLWDTATGEPLYLLNGQAEQVVGVAYAPNGRYIATADGDQMVWLWDPFRGRVLRRLRSHAGEITGLTFTPDSRRILSGGTDGRIILWDVYTGRNLFKASDALRSAMRLSLSPGGSQVACLMGGNALHLWDLRRQPAVCEALPLASAATAVAHSPDGKWLATGHERGEVQLWDRRTHRPLAPWHQHQTRISALVFSPSRPVLASAGGADGYVYLWSLKDGTPLLLIPEAARKCSVETIAFVPNSPWFLAAGVDWTSFDADKGTVQLWDLQRPGVVATADFGMTALRVHPSGETFVAALLDESLGLFETRSLKLIRELPGQAAGQEALCFSPDGRWLAMAGEDMQVRICSMPTGKLQTTLDLDSPVRDLAFFRDGNYLCTANANSTLYVIEIPEDLRNLEQAGVAGSRASQG